MQESPPTKPDITLTLALHVLYQIICVTKKLFETHFGFGKKR